MGITTQMSFVNTAPATENRKLAYGSHIVPHYTTSVHPHHTVRNAFLGREQLHKQLLSSRSPPSPRSTGRAALCIHLPPKSMQGTPLQFDYD